MKLVVFLFIFGILVCLMANVNFNFGSTSKLRTEKLTAACKAESENTLHKECVYMLFFAKAQVS